MAFIDLDRVHLEMRKIALVHEEMQGRYEVSKIGIDADIVIESWFEMQNIVFICLLINVLNRHLGVEELIELSVALSVVTDSTFS